jgi:hypothetical protein
MKCIDVYRRARTTQCHLEAANRFLAVVESLNDIACLYVLQQATKAICQGREAEVHRLLILLTTGFPVERL